MSSEEHDMSVDMAVEIINIMAQLRLPSMVCSCSQMAVQ